MNNTTSLIPCEKAAKVNQILSIVMHGCICGTRRVKHALHVGGQGVAVELAQYGVQKTRSLT
jgi:hypothetical protein